ncbi:FAD-dependent oxidoreductase [Candidatus Bathyarchaeota archaeon]|nr:FAD-dependent oxidoreductase [Candidatus Bathyarchaeota archaeon]
MLELNYDGIVIGAGPAGIAAAIRAKELGLKVVLIENRDLLGGIPLQCVHPGFGLHYFREDLTGTEFIYRLFDKMDKVGVEYLLKSHVHSIEFIAHNEKIVNVITPKGVLSLKAKTLIYTAGARERHMFEINIAGDRPAGIYTAGEAQILMDMYGIIPGKEIVIVGSGDIGLIMARRFALEGAKVKAVIELMYYPGGLIRNVVQCLQDYNIPLYLSHAVTRVVGKKRVEKVVVAKVDEKLRPIKETEFEIPCDTVVLAAGLIPNLDMLEKIGLLADPYTRGPIVNEFLETNIPGVFVAGNALVINDLVDYVVEQGELAAEGARYFLENDGIPTMDWKPVVKGRNIRFVVPHYVSGRRDVTFYARVQYPEKNVIVTIPEVGWRMKMFNVRPAEMVRVKLSKRLLDGASSAEKISIEVAPSE